jgi:CBS domain containing-hemolysin-like protein
MVAGELSLFLFLLALSGFFASAEVAFFGLNLLLLEREGSKATRLVKKLLEKPVDLIITILVGNEVVNILISSVGTTLLKNSLGDFGVAIGTVLISVLIFYFGEVIPKNVALRIPEKLATLYALPIYLFEQVIYPIGWVIKKLFGRLIEKVEGKHEETITVEEFLYYLKEAQKSGEIDEKEFEMVKRALELSDTTVEEIMTPRTDIFALEKDKRVEEVIDEIIKREHSKIPLFEGNLDKIIGVLYTKSLLPVEDNLNRKLEEFSKPIGFVPQFLDLENLLLEFKQKKTQIFMVLDEHGGTAGLVTYSDLFSWLLGEMVEEWSEERELQKIGRNTYLVDASVSIEFIAEKFGIKLPEDYEYSTLGGFLFAHFKELPKAGDTLTVDGIRFTVQEVENNRIKTVKVVKTEY